MSLVIHLVIDDTSFKTVSVFTIAENLFLNLIDLTVRDIPLSK